MDNFIDYYKVLGINAGATPEEIKKAYRELSKKCHPDLNPNTDGIYQQKLNEAYEILKDPAKKLAYDCERKYYYESTAQPKNNNKNQDGYSNQSRANQPKQQSQTSKKNSEENNLDFVYGITTEFMSLFSLKAWRKAWQRVKATEKDEPKIGDRFHSREEQLNKLKETNADVLSNVSFNVMRLFTHVVEEIKYQVKKGINYDYNSLPEMYIRNRCVLAVLMSAVVLLTSAALAPEETEPDLSTTTAISETKEQYLRLYRMYEVQYGDDLSGLAYIANCSVGEIQSLNGKKNSLIFAGETLKIPYVVNEEDIEYATQSVDRNGLGLDTLAKQYETTMETLRILNAEAIDEETGSIISDTLLVPTFASQDEIKEQKSAKSYTYTNQG